MGIRKCAAEAPLLKGIPSEYMTNGQIFYSCESEEETLPYVLERVGDEIILYASDYPHWNSTTKDREAIAQRATLSDEQKRRVLGANARRLYRLD